MASAAAANSPQSVRVPGFINSGECALITASGSWAEGNATYQARLRVRSTFKSSHIGDARHSHLVPCVDGSELARRIFTPQKWSVQPRVQSINALCMTAGIIPSADQVPVKNPHSRMRWHEWAVLIAGSTASAFLFALPTSHRAG
jgi:hypothetical protein